MTCLQLVTLEYDKLNTAIDDLGTNIGLTLDEQKKDIEQTHDKELRKVQVSVDELSKEKIQLEDDIASNKRACQLETERDWLVSHIRFIIYSFISIHILIPYSLLYPGTKRKLCIWMKNWKRQKQR